MWKVGELTLELVRQEDDKQEAALFEGAEMVQWELIVWREIVC